MFTEEEGIEYEVDVVILATGYQLSFPFLDKSSLDSIVDKVENSVNLYKYIIPIGPQTPTMVFIFQSYQHFFVSNLSLNYTLKMTLQKNKEK
jgi:lysine/ornithine N-monooxygenase